MAAPATHSKREEIERLCRSDKSVSSEYAKNPDEAPGTLGERLFSTHHLKAFAHKGPDERKPLTAEDLDWARSCGKFGDTKPSELFLHAYHDLLQCIGHDPLANCCAPSLCGAVGYAPMTIIAPLNDQLRHMSNLIVRAKREVLLATNFWKASGATTFVTDALLELSKRAGARGERVVVKLMFDRGSVKQVCSTNLMILPYSLDYLYLASRSSTITRTLHHRDGRRLASVFQLPTKSPTSISQWSTSIVRLWAPSTANS